MKKSTAIFVILITLAIIGGIGWYIYSTKIAPSTAGGGSTPFEGFAPLGGGGTINVPIKTPQQPDQPATSTPIQTKLPNLRHLTTTPVAGAIATTTASSTSVVYVDRGVGHVYSMSLTSNTPATKITNTTIPRVYTALINQKANAVIYRYLKEGTSLVSNFYGDIVLPRPAQPKSSTTTLSGATSTTITTSDVVGELRGKFFPTTIIDAVVSPKGDRIFILSETVDGSVGYISQFNGDKQSKVFQSPLKQLSIDWSSEDSVIIAPRATYAGVGIVYDIDLKKGTTEKILGPLRALSARMSKDSKHIMYTATPDGQKLSSYMFTVKDKSIQDMVFRTLPEKCVWSKNNPSIIFCAVPSDMRVDNLPDVWYQGIVSFNDTIWEYDTDTGEVRQLSNLYDQAGTAIDATNLILDPKENYLVFTNKNDLTLWSLDINE